MKNMTKKKIVVLGAAGNIGVYYIDYLIKNLDFDKYEIIATDIAEEYPYTFYNGKYIKLDITNQKDFEKLPLENVDAVVDFAGILPAYDNSNNQTRYIDINTKGTLNILEYCKKSKANKIIYMQTWADLNGYLNDKKPLKPYLDYKPIRTGDHAVYCVSKIAAVELIKHYYYEFGLKYFIFRLPNVYMYSPQKYYYVNGEKKYISYRLMIDRAKKGQDIELWGNSELGKDVLYVKDLCQMIYKSMLCNLENGIYNAGTGVKTTIKEQIEGIIDVFCPKSKKSNIIYCPEKKDCDDFVMDIKNIEKDLNYEVKYTYKEYLIDYKKEEKLNRFIKR